MRCNGCDIQFLEDEIDSSGFCYECANHDPDPKPDLMATVVQAARSAYERLLQRVGRKVDRGDAN